MVLDNTRIKTTDSERRHAFRSFRERIDSLKIEPSRHLSKRVHDNVQSSHFLATLDHWKEVNISGNFTAFLEIVEPLVQSLPQILHHQREIVDALFSHAAKNDPNSLQPMLELLAQFVHDLGPDFMPYYSRFLHLVTDLAIATNPNDLQNSRNSSNLLEHIFNAVAYVFKYLSKTLCTDILPTFEVLTPLLSLNKKPYIARFCAEALSFLVRKLAPDALQSALQYTLVANCDLVAKNETYCESLIVLYSEAMKNTKGSFHSRSSIILTSAFDVALMSAEVNSAILSILQDVLLEIIHHGSTEACDKFYNLVTLHLQTKLLANSTQSMCIAVSQVLAALSFAELGRNISSWLPIVATIDSLGSAAIKLPESSSLAESMQFLFTIVVRNCDTETFAKGHRQWLQIMMQINNGHSFLSFAETALTSNPAKALQMGLAKHILESINRAASKSETLPLVALFLSRMHANDSYGLSPAPSVSLKVRAAIIDTLKTKYTPVKTFDDLMQVHWRLLILRHGQGSAEVANELPLFSKILDSLVSPETDFAGADADASSLRHDVAAAVLDAMCLLSPSLTSASIHSILEKVVQCLPEFKESSLFVASFKRFLAACKDIAPQFLQDNYTTIVFSLCENLRLPHHDSRINAIDTIITMHALTSRECPESLLQIQLIEQIPLTLPNGRDITLRIRHLGLDFAKTRNSPLECSAMGHFIFGLLSNRFLPSWSGVLETLPGIVGQFTELFWANCMFFIKMDFASQDQQYYPLTISDLNDNEIDLLDWQARDKRIKASYGFFERQYFAKYRAILPSIMEYSENLRARNVYSQHMRSQVVQALAAVPHIAERHSDKMVPMVLNQRDMEVDEDEDEQNGDDHVATNGKPESSFMRSWLVKERNDVLSLFAKFKNLKRVHNADALYAHLLNLLCNKHLQIQKMALDVILNWGVGVVNKYRDNLKNLLDDTIFRDELSNFVTRTTDAKIEDQDLSQIMPLVLRILYGRVQGSPKSNSKLGKKFAVVSVLPNLSDEFIDMFLALGAQRIGYEGYFELDDFVLRDDRIQFRKLMGYVNLLLEVYDCLGPKYALLLSTTIKPLVFALVLAQAKIDLSKSPGSDNTEKSARSVRQVGMRCLSELFKTLGETFAWDQYIPVIYQHVIRARLPNFAAENLQQPSSLMRIMSLWVEMPNTIKFLYTDDFRPADAIISLLAHPNAKDSVITVVLQFAIQALSKKNMEDPQYFELLARLVYSLMNYLPAIIDNITNNENGSLAISVLLLLIDGDYIEENETKASLLDSLTKALDKPNSQISLADKANILHSLSSLVSKYDCTFAEITPLFEACSKAFQFYADAQVRLTLVQVFEAIGLRFTEVQEIASILANLNSYTNRRLHDMDFTKRLDAFKAVNETLYHSLTPTQWLPLVYCALFFINDEQELAIRTNATYLLKRFIDCFAAKETEVEAKPFVHILKNIILPHLRMGLRKENEDVKSEYIELLHHVVQTPQYFDDLKDMRVLTYDNHEESNFFKNVNHIQMHRRQRAVMRLAESREQLSENSIAHYILPIIEAFATNPEEKFRNIAFETVESICFLTRRVGWNHFKAIFKRYIANLRASKPEQLRSHVNLITAMAKACMHSVQAHEIEKEAADAIRNMPPQGPDLDTYILRDIFPPILKVLSVRDDHTIVARAPLSEGLTYLVMCISPSKIASELPGILTTTCQVMRSRSEELREAVRKSLSKIATLLGPQYLKFIITELKTALSRGSQIHVLSYTVHYIMAQMQSSLKHGDLNDLASLIVDVIMEDIFGAAGQEKDAEGYHSKMKEVKYKKSFDSGELLTSNVDLSYFGTILSPIKLLLREHMPLKTQNKLDELLRRYALGLNHNDSGKSQDILLTCYEIYHQASEVLSNDRFKQRAPIKAHEDHFLVKLNAKPSKAQISNNLHIHTLQRFAFELLRTAISRNQNLLTVASLSGFVPLLEQGLVSENEGVIISCLRILNVVIRLDFAEAENAIFEKCTQASLTIIQDTPSTNSEICQLALKFLATAIRHKPEIELTDGAISYIVVRLQPDLEEPTRQGLAFNFLKAVVARHFMVPEIYDTMEKVSKIMVVNHSKEIRDMSRSVYLQFLLEYDQGRGKLEKQFSFLVNNLAYPTELGRQSVMELIHSIILKSGPEILGKLASSFFVALSNVIIVDDSSKCREMAQSLIASIFKKLGKEKALQLATYCHAWISQDGNAQLQRCGFNTYRIYLAEFKYGANEELDSTAESKIASILELSKRVPDSDEEGSSWELVYGALAVFTTLVSELRDAIFARRFEGIWNLIVDTLLYPHSWVRLLASRLVGVMLGKLKELSFSVSGYQLQTIAYRLLHQLSAPLISESLGDQNVKNLVCIAIKWEKEQTLFEDRSEEAIDDQATDAAPASKHKYKYANEYLVAKTCVIMRQQHNYQTSISSKKAAIKLLAMLIQITNGDNVGVVAEQVLLSLNNFVETEQKMSAGDEELATLATECMQMIEDKLGVSEYTRVYANVKQIISSRRQDRKTKRAQLALNAPDIAAKRKMRKHERFREKRKHEKDENGYYRDKRRRFDSPRA